MSPTLHWFCDGTTTSCGRTADMPKLYFEDGRPRALIIATLPKMRMTFQTVILRRSNNNKNNLKIIVIKY